MGLFESMKRFWREEENCYQKSENKTGNKNNELKIITLLFLPCTSKWEDICI